MQAVSVTLCLTLLLVTAWAAPGTQLDSESRSVRDKYVKDSNSPNSPTMKPEAPVHHGKVYGDCKVQDSEMGPVFSCTDYCFNKDVPAYRCENGRCVCID